MRWCYKLRLVRGMIGIVSNTCMKPLLWSMRRASVGLSNSLTFLAEANRFVLGKTRLFELHQLPIMTPCLCRVVSIDDFFIT